MVAVLGAGCERAERLSGGFPTPPPETVTPTKALKSVEPRPDTELQRQIEAITSAAGGRVGVSALVLETGESVSLNGDKRFPMQSVYKLPIAMAVLHAVDDERVELDELIGVTPEDMVGANQHSPIRDKYPKGEAISVREIMRYAVSESDGTASDVLMRLAGGADPIQLYLTAIGAGDIAVINTEKELGSDQKLQYANYATPDAAVKLLRCLYEGNGISDSNRELLLKFLNESGTGPKRLKGLLPTGTAVAHKTGTGPTQNGISAATNDIGIITMPNGRHLFIAVFVSDSPADEKTREGVIARAAKAAWDKWSR